MQVNSGDASTLPLVRRWGGPSHGVQAPCWALGLAELRAQHPRLQSQGPPVTPVSLSLWSPLAPPQGVRCQSFARHGTGPKSGAPMLLVARFGALTADALSQTQTRGS